MQRMSLLAALALLMVLSPTYAAAQATTARLVGTVKEPTGAVIPGASVVATNLDTGTRRDAITNDEGDFVIPNVPIGRYEVAAELFRTWRADGVLVDDEEPSFTVYRMDAPDEDGVVRQVMVEAPGEFRVSSAEHVLAQLP